MRRRSKNWSRQSGQAVIIIFVFMAVLLLGMLGLATDYAQIWAKRQMTQAAADAACQAAAGDLLLQYENSSASSVYSLDFSWIGSSFDCSTNASSPPCVYAAKNGYSGSKVAVSFPSSVTGAPDLSGFGTIAHPYVQVTITEPVDTSFVRLFHIGNTVNTGATAICGLNPVAVPVPLVVLHSTSASSLSTQGSPTITILGGPNRAIQVDSSSSTAVNVGGSSGINLAGAGPAGTGADFGVFGTETKPTGVTMGTGTWVSPSTPLGDPWVTVSTPATTGRPTGAALAVGFSVDGCPDPAGCVEFTPGIYTSCVLTTSASGFNACLALPFGGSNAKFSNFQARQPGTPYVFGNVVKPSPNNPNNSFYQATGGGTTSSTTNNLFTGWSTKQNIGDTVIDGGVTWINVGQSLSTAPNTAIFQPGVYYLGTGGLSLGSNSTARMSTAAGDGTEGATFYFSTSATIAVASNAGNSAACTAASAGSGTPNGCVVSYKPAGTSTLGVTSRQLKCSAAGSTPIPAAVPATIDGNILFGPCTGTWGDSSGQNRGFLFFQNRSVSASPSWGGGGQFLLSGFLYFHSSTTGDTCGTNTTCLTLAGNSGAGAFTLGNIVADKISLGGSSGIKMILNPASTFQVLKPQLIR